MNEMKQLVLGKTTETLIKTLFNERLVQESSEESLTTATRSMRIKDLQIQVLSFMKRNPNSKFELIVPEYKVAKTVRLTFSNFETYDDNDETSFYSIVIQDNFTDADIIQKMKIGKDIILKLKSRNP